MKEFLLLHLRVYAKEYRKGIIYMSVNWWGKVFSF